MNKALPRWAVCVFFAVFLALGLLTAADYGPSWDEQTEMDILRMNLWEYARVLGLDESRFETLAARQGPLSIETLRPISQSIEQDHGTAAFYPFGWVVLDLSLTGAQQSALWHMACWAVFTLGGFALYATLRQMGLSRGWALLGPVCLLLSPQFFAHGHFNNKDIALFSLALCGCGRRWRWREGRALRAALLCALRRAGGQHEGGGAGAVGAVRAVCACPPADGAPHDPARLGRGRGDGPLLRSLLRAAHARAVGRPGGLFRLPPLQRVAFQRWNGYVLFRGSVFDTASQPLPWYYLPYMMLATTPLWVLMLCAAGTALALWTGVRRLRARDASGLIPLLTVLLWLLPLAFAVLTRTRVYNGWRHFYFLYGPMLALAVLGARELWTHMRGAGGGSLPRCWGCAWPLPAWGSPRSTPTSTPITSRWYSSAAWITTSWTTGT